MVLLFWDLRLAVRIAVSGQDPDTLEFDLEDLQEAWPSKLVVTTEKGLAGYVAEVLGMCPEAHAKKLQKLFEEAAGKKNFFTQWIWCCDWHFGGDFWRQLVREENIKMQQLHPVDGSSVANQTKKKQLPKADC